MCQLWALHVVTKPQFFLHLYRYGHVILSVRNTCHVTCVLNVMQSVPSKCQIKEQIARYLITGPPTVHSVGGQTSNGRWRLSSSVTLAYAT